MNNSAPMDNAGFEFENSPLSEQQQSIKHKLRNIVSVSQLIRCVGAAAVIASMSLFLMQGWSEGNDITRYLKLLAQTGLLTGVGLILSFVVKEYKGARVFFALSLVSVVANFTILGALTFSMMQWDGHLTDYPSMMKWVVVDASTFTAVFAGAFALLAIVSRFSFSIFSRHIAGKLTMAFLLLCSVLLIPVRSSLAVSLLAGVSIWLAIIIVNKLRQHEKVVLTREAKGAFGLLFLPAAIIVMRAISLYHVDDVLLTGLCALLYIGIRAVATRIDQPALSQRVLEITQYSVGICLSFLAIGLLPYAAHTYKAFLLAAMILALLLDQLHRSKDASWKSWALNFTAFGLVFINLWVAAFEYDLSWKLSSLAVSALVFAVNWRAALYVDNHHIASLSANIGIAVSLVLLATRVVEIINMSNWMLIGTTGVILIVGASLYERYGLSFSAMKNKSKD